MESSRIFVKNLPPTISEAEFRKHFSAKGREVTDIKLIPKRRIGYVGFKSPQDAASAVKYFHRSYIRLSRISVELARPISAPELPTSKKVGLGHADASAAVTQRPITPPKEEQSKKRKRDDLDESDPKLQEYLEVMDPVRAAKKARDLDVPMPREEDSAAVPLVEGESDDEYEDIPPRVSVPPAENEAEQPPEKANVTTTSLGTNTPPPEGQEAPPLGGRTAEIGTTDDEWLRSRTNRLLDLVDPDDPALAGRKRPTAVAAGQIPTDSGGPIDETGADPAPVEQQTQDVKPAELKEGESPTGLITQTRRIFVRNLPYSVTEDDLSAHFATYGALEEVHLPVDSQGKSKGFALILFADSSAALAAFHKADGSIFQGRIIHVLPAAAKKEQKLDEFAIAKLPLKKQNLIRKRAEAASHTFNWNSLFMSQDAVNASVADRLGVSKAELLDPTSSDAMVKQAIAETSVIQETKAYFAANGVDLNAFQSKQRGDTAILVKNFPYGTTLEELRKMFEEYGTVLRVLMPPSGTIAIVQFVQPAHAKVAFARLAYRRIKDSILFLEKAPKNLFVESPPPPQAVAAAAESHGARPGVIQKISATELLEGDESNTEQVETSSLFVRNLNFATTTEQLAETFRPLDGFVSARVKTKVDPKKPGQILSMGFGFVEFRTKEQAQAAMKVMDGHVLQGHVLTVKASHRGLDAAEERRREDRAKKAAGQRTKIVVKNLPFEATKKDVRALFSTYGQLRSVRVPKKFNSTSRGFAFAEFTTAREAENALHALQDTHLLGRRLVLDFAEAEAVDPEEEIAKMQKKIGGQVNKVALQKLTGRGRQKVSIGGHEDDAGDEV